MLARLFVWFRSLLRRKHCKHSSCHGPYARSGVFVCYDCAIHHDEFPRTTCLCDDCRS